MERLGLSDNTLIIYSSDHGCHFRTRNAEYKRSPHDASLRVPLIACGPGFRGGRVVEELVSLIDLPASVVAAAGLAVPQAFQGRPLQGLVDGTARNWPQEIFAQISGEYIGRAVRTRKWKYAVWVPSDNPNSGKRVGGSERYHEQCLYDLEVDPHERNNLVKEPSLSGTRGQLAATLQRRMVEAGERVAEIVPAV